MERKLISFLWVLLMIPLSKASAETVSHSQSVQQDLKAGHVYGKVEDRNGVALPGVTIQVKGTKIMTVTNTVGNYEIDMQGLKSGTIVFSYVGMTTQEINYKGQISLNVILQDDATLLDDVVVTGYGTYNRGQYVGAVNQVKAEDVLVAGENSIDQMLQGVVPGMSVLNTTGKVGGTPKIRIRGTSTLLGNQEPLWVVDDVIQTNPTPIPNDASPLSDDMHDLAQTAGNAISWLNPNDIESITVLKDASATAIYGSQASNGVIVITTKKAKENGGFSVNYSGNMSINQRPAYSLYDMMNSQQYMRFNQEMYQDRNSYNAEIRNIGYGGLVRQLQNKEITREEFAAAFRKMENQNTDWFGLLFRTAVSTQQNISISASSQKVSSRISLGYDRTLGDARENAMTGFTASSNNTFRISDKLMVDFSLNGSHRVTNDYAYGVSPYEYAMNTSRAIPAYNENGSYFYHDKMGASSHSYPSTYYYNYNILNEIGNTGARTQTNTFQSNLTLHWDVVPHLQFQGNASIALAQSRIKSYATEYSYYITSIRGYEYGSVTPNSAEELASPLPYGGLLQVQNSNSRNISFRAALVYSNTLRKVHNVTLNLGLQTTSNKIDGETNMRYGYLKYRGESFANVPEVITPVASANASATTLHDDMAAGSSVVNTISNTVSEYLTAVYGYDNRYVVNMNFRVDASNRFGQDENKKFNPAFSLGAKWRLGEEHFMQNFRGWFDMFDVSFSYGLRGNAVTAVSPYLIATDLGIVRNFGQYGLRIKSLPYPGLGWEKTSDWNLGLDMSFLRGRLSAGLNVYNKHSKVLSSHEIPMEYGDLNAYVDGTVMDNHGYEIIISYTPIRTKDWTWSLSFNTAKDVNEISNNNRVNNPSDYFSGTAIVPGEAYGTLYAYDFAGLNPENGRPMFNGLNKSKTPTDFKDYLVKAGCLEPDITGGVSTALRYKNWHLRAAFAMSLGGQRFLPTYAATAGMPRPEQNVPTYMLDRWRKPGDELITNIPAIPAGNRNDLYVTLPYQNVQDASGSVYDYQTDLYTMYNLSTEKVADSDFIRCRSIGLQYDIPRDFMRRIGLTSGYVGVNLTNPFCITFDSKWKGRDPETGNWPARRTLAFSLNLSF